MKPLHTLLLLPALALCACIENEEEITIRSDGSLSVRVAAHGDASDFTHGYPVPLHAPWRAGGDHLRRWTAEVGTDTGSTQVRARFQPGDWKREGKDEDQEDVRLEARADFASIDDWPSGFAPSHEPYGTAYLQRSAELEIEERGGRRIYSFVRTFHSKNASNWSGHMRVEQEIPEEIGQKIQDDVELTRAEWEVIARVMGDTIKQGGAAIARDALVGVYTRGDASLPTEAHERILASLVRTIESRVGVEVWKRLIQDSKERESGNPLDDFEEELRAAGRASLQEALELELLAPQTRNAIMEQFEWHLTAYDHLGDLRDEKFKVVVNMPGRIVSGNFQSVEGSRAEWHFKGEQLSRDVELRVISVED